MSKSTTFAKLFDTPSGQLLVTKTYDDENNADSHELTASMVFEDAIKVDMSLGFASLEQRDVKFDKFDQSNADEFAQALTKTIYNGEGDSPLEPEK